MAEPIIETRALTRRFGARIAVLNAGLRVPEAGIYGFLGPNGAGKTTTIRMLLGLIRPDEGEVRLFGRSLAGHHRELMRSVGALVETPSLYAHLTGEENLEVTRRLVGGPRANTGEALAIVRLTQDAGRRVREYSLGMRQRLGLALALLNRPRLLILDEPSNGLDPAGIQEMRGLLRRLAREQGITVFLSSHLLGEIEQVADHIGIIHEGRLLFQGTLGTLQTKRHDQLVLGVAPVEGARAALVEAGWSARQREDGRLVVAGAAPGDAARINRTLVEKGFDVDHVSVSRASLEDIFLALTGAGSADGEAA
jgi:ABC-type multidrug transport system ATPase subunit